MSPDGSQSDLDRSILLQGGTVLIHVPSTSGDYEVHTLEHHSLLVVNNKIESIAASIQAPSVNTDVIDCRGKLISPGFVDTHHHLWQTQLKGRHANELLLDYLVTGAAQAFNYEPDDVFWGQLGGCLEAIDAGTTTVVDHALINYSPDHSDAALSASVAAGIRTFFCYTPIYRLTSWNPIKIDPELVPDWSMQQLERLSKYSPYGDGRVVLGLAFDGMHLPKQQVVELFQKVRSWGTPLITLHYVNTPLFGFESLISLLASYDLLGPDVLFSHANQPHATDGPLLQRHGGHVSSTPVIEMQMAHGLPSCFEESLYSRASLGIDCHSNNCADMMTQMRFGLQTARGVYNQKFIEQKKNPHKVNATVVEAFNLGTILGARAVRLEDQIGSLDVGKLADIVVFDMKSPAMVCAAQHDPVAAIVMHASVRDIDTVIVDGVVRKKAGRLVDLGNHELAGAGGLYKMQTVSDAAQLSWDEVADKLLRSRERIQEKIDRIDLVKAKAEWMEAVHIDSAGFVDASQLV